MFWCQIGINATGKKNKGKRKRNMDDVVAYNVVVWWSAKDSLKRGLSANTWVERGTRNVVFGNIQGNLDMKTCKTDVNSLEKSWGQLWGTFQNIHLTMVLDGTVDDIVRTQRTKQPWSKERFIKVGSECEDVLEIHQLTWFASIYLFYVGTIAIQ